MMNTLELWLRRWLVALGWVSLLACVRLPAAVALPVVPTETLSTVAPTPAATAPRAPTSLSTPSPSPTPEWTMTPTLTASPMPPNEPIRAVRVDYGDYAASRSEIDALEQRLRQAGVNWVALGAGRMDWTYFKWPGHEADWSSDVRDTGVDFLAEDTARFKTWASHVSVVVDVFAERYLQAHPEAAAITAQGQPSAYLVSTMQLVEGDYGNALVEVLDYVAANYPVDSIALTELAYQIEGYGEDDKAAYLTYTQRRDWPRTDSGLINIDHPSIGEWRSYEVNRFIERAAEAVHRHGKQLFVDVNVSWGHLAREAAEYGEDYALMLEHADRIVVWDYFGMSGYQPEYTEQIGRYLQKYGPDRVILSVGLWDRGGGIISAEALRRAMLAGINSPIPHLWITPSRDLSEAHWQVLEEVWGTLTTK